jgi:hypothetical protein
MERNVMPLGCLVSTQLAVRSRFHCGAVLFFAACTVLGGAASNLWLKDGRVKALGLGVFLKIGFSSGYTPTA